MDRALNDFWDQNVEYPVILGFNAKLYHATSKKNKEDYAEEPPPLFLFRFQLSFASLMQNVCSIILTDLS